MVDLRESQIPSNEIRQRLMHEHGVVVVHGAAYGPGGEGTLRVSFASGGDKLTRGLDRPARRARENSGVALNDALERELKAEHRRRSPVRQDFPRAVFDRCERVSNRAVRRGDPETSRGPDSRIVEICRRIACPLTMRGGGTSQAGQAIGEGIIVDTSKYFHRLLEVNAEERWARVEPGIVLDELNAQLAPLGLRFAPDISTASRATIGGMMANNSAGARSVLYGKTIDHVLEQTVLLADGSIAHFREMPRDEIPAGESLEAALLSDGAWACVRNTPRRSTGGIPKFCGASADTISTSSSDAPKPVNLAKIMVGSEGTLGSRARGEAEARSPAEGESRDGDRVQRICSKRSPRHPLILRHGPSAVEVMDKAILDNTRQNAALDRIRKSFIEGDPGATLCVEFYGIAREDLPAAVCSALEEDLRAKQLRVSYRQETDPAAQARIWSLREAALGLSMAMKEDAKSIPFVEDTAVAPERLSEFIARFLDILRAHETTAGIYAHASVGCLHVRPVINMKTEEGVRKFEAIANEVADLVLEYGGALSGEHGDGLVRSPFMQQMFGDAIYEAFREIKRTFDPRGDLQSWKNRGCAASDFESAIRHAATPRGIPKHFSIFRNMAESAGAVEMCSGVGACRKKLAGNMCPSYMATREESDSTRGRANVLRLAISGQLDEAGLGDDGVLRVLDLCLECRACKTECPVGVDMARFKSEFLADYYSRHGTPLQAHVLGNIDRLSNGAAGLRRSRTGSPGAVYRRSQEASGLEARRRSRDGRPTHET